MSASLHTAGSIGRAAAGVVLEPYQLYKSTKARSDLSDAHAGPSRAIQRAENETQPSGEQADTVSSDKKKVPSTHLTATAPRKNEDQRAIMSGSSESTNRTREIMKVSAKNAGKFFFSPIKGIVLDIPLAAVEGMWALPRLHDDTGYQHTAVKDWKSGGSVAAKSLVHGIHEGMTDVFIKTYAGKKKEGAKGVAKGLSMGFVNLTMKTGAGALGLIAYPCQGMYKSIHAAMHTKARNAVEQAKFEEGEWLMNNQPMADIEIQDVVQQFLHATPVKGNGKSKVSVWGR